MPEFILDTSGVVYVKGALGHPAPGFETAYQWHMLDSFTQGYIEALFFTDEETLCEESGREMPSVAFNMKTMESRFVGGNSPGFADLAPATLAKIVADCAAFQAANRALLDEATGRDDYDDEAAGRDFWYTRNGHGVGYWDRSQLENDSEEYESLTADMVAASKSGDNAAWGKACDKRSALKAESLGERLAKVAQACGGRDSYVGDDGLVYLD